MSPEARQPASAGPRRTSLWRDAALGLGLSLPVALLLSRVSPAAFRTGAAAIAFLVVLGLSTRWAVALGAAPVMWLAAVAQVSDDFTRVPKGRAAVGSLVMAASAAIVVLALWRWEGDRRQARDEARSRLRNERRLQALVDFAHHLASVASRSELFAAAEREAPIAVGGTGVVLVTSDGEHLEFPVVAGHRNRDEFPLQLPTDHDHVGTPAVDVLRSGRPVFCSSAGELLERYPTLDLYVARSGHQAWAALPIADLGVLVFSWDEEQVFSPAQRAFLVTVANLFAAAADRIGVVERAHLERFVAAFDAMVDGVGIHRAVRDPAGRIVDFEIEYLNRTAVSPGDHRADLVGLRMSDAWPGSPMISYYARVVETGEPFVLEDTDVSLLGGPYSETEAVSIRASRLDDQRIVLVIRDMTERARLVREVQEANAMFSAAEELAHVGSWRYDFPEDRLEWSPELYRIVGVPETEPPVRPRDGELFGYEHPDDRGLAIASIRKALQARESFSFDMRLIRQRDGEIRDVSTTGAFVTDETGNVIGVWGATQDITDRRRAERSRRAALEALELEREAVAALQQVIIPSELPTVPGASLSAHYRAATLSHAVGGDWYDAFLAPDGRIILVIGDVAGHGIECAALANELRVSVRIRVGDGMGPAEILELLDAEVGDGFVTCWLAMYEPVGRRLRVANAGHPPAVLSRNGSVDTVAGRTVPPLGTRRFDAGREEELELGPGDFLVLYTDGLVERRGEDLDRGISRLRTMAPLVESLPDPALSLVEHLAHDAEDDVCVVTMRIA